jgi:hypothetical protein
MSADELEDKGDRLFDLNCIEAAKQCWEEAERLRKQQEK